MTIPAKYEPLHQGALAALRETLKHLPTAYLSLASMFREVCERPEAHWPHPVYLLDEDDLEAGGGLNDAQLVGWQFLAKADGTRAYAIEVQGSLKGKDCRFAKLSHGSFVDGLSRALDNPDLQEMLSTGATQLAVLVVSELDTQAVWFRAPNPVQEFLFAPTSNFLNPWPAIYGSKQFEEALRKEALRVD